MEYGLLAFMLKLSYELVRIYIHIRQCSLYIGMYGFNLYILFYLCGSVVSFA